MQTKPELQMDALRKTYLLPRPLVAMPAKGGSAAPKTKKALDGVSLTLGPGLYGLLGPNGAGKSTLIQIITGGLAPDSGQVLWCGRAARRAARGIGFRRVLGYMPQQQGLYDSYTGRRFLAYLAALKEIPRKAVPAEVDRVAAAGQPVRPAGQAAVRLLRRHEAAAAAGLRPAGRPPTADSGRAHRRPGPAGTGPAADFAGLDGRGPGSSWWPPMWCRMWNPSPPG